MGVTAKRGSLEPYVKDEIEYYDYQVEGVRWMGVRKSCLLADDMGLGKSLQALTVFGMDVFMGRATSAIVVCPASLKGNWMDEIDKFTRIPAIELGRTLDKKGRPRSMTPKERQLQLKEFRAMTGAKILVTNYEQVVAHLPDLIKMNFDMGIYDEAHYLKNVRAKRTKASLDLKTRRSLMLTGSPMLNKVDELWPLLHKIDPDQYGHFYSFRQRYCVFGGYGGKEIVGVQNEQELSLRLQSVMLRRLKDDVLDLRKPQIVQRKVDLLPEQQRIYDEAMTEMQISMPDSVEQMDPMEIQNGMTKFLRLKQICATTATVFGPGHDVSGKLDLVVQDSAEILSTGNKVIVFTQFRTVLDAYKARIENSKDLKDVPVFELHGDVPIVHRQEVVKAWSSQPGPAIIVCMLQVAGVGLNMTAARHIQFIDKLFVPMLNRQAVDRAHRIGQDKTQAVQVFEYITRGSVEERIEKILHVKKELFDTVVEDTSWKRKLLEAVLAGD